MTSPIPARTIAAAASAFDVDAAAIISENRTRFVSHARFAVYAALRAAGLSLNDAARACGGRDHSTVISGVERCTELRTDATYDALYQVVEAAARGADYEPTPFVPQQRAPSLAYFEQWPVERTRIRFKIRGKDNERVEAKIKALNVAMRELVQVLKEL